MSIIEAVTKFQQAFTETVFRKSVSW